MNKPLHNLNTQIVNTYSVVLETPPTQQSGHCLPVGTPDERPGHGNRRRARNPQAGQTKRALKPTQTTIEEVIMQNESEISSMDIDEITKQETANFSRKIKNLRKAKALRKLEMMREELDLKSWMTEVWEEPCDTAGAEPESLEVSSVVSYQAA